MGCYLRAVDYMQSGNFTLGLILGGGQAYSRVGAKSRINGKEIKVYHE